MKTPRNLIEVFEQDHSTQMDSTVSPPLADVIARAVNEAATDVHIDMWGQQAVLRFRVDGMIHHNGAIGCDEARRLVNQIKVAANMDLVTALTRQESHFRWHSRDRCRDIRATVVATAPEHEAAHLRLLTLPEEWHDVCNLGLGDRQFETVENVLRHPHGLVLVAGPTGSGKTTTLYSLTGLTDLRDQIAASIEDPAEFDLPYVRQLEINERRGFTMEEGLKTILRIDADIVLVGEIRDVASATIAARAALAGRLVLATIHARDAAMAIRAMRYLSVPDYVLGGALRLVIAQNLVRKLCSVCARQRSVTPYERTLFENMKLTPPDVVHDPTGCPQCFQHGYQGRTGVFQVAPIDTDLGHCLAAGQPVQSLRDRLALLGARSLVSQALEKVAKGITSMQELAQLYDDTLDQSFAVLPPDMEQRRDGQ
jgi:type II secretory ATPase GspE/PulE/Tfp pilus assembly ATPase PilB-like protein